MKKIYTFFTVFVIFAFVAFMATTISSSDFSKENVDIVNSRTVSDTTTQSKTDAWIEGQKKDETSYVLSVLGKPNGFTNYDKIFLTATSTDSYGYNHRKYQHYYRELLVYGSELIIHQKRDSIASYDGRIFPVTGVDINPTLSQNDALEKACSFVGAKRYIWQDDSSKLPKGNLFLKPLSGNSENPFVKLCWQFTIQSRNPERSYSVIIDANSGALIDKVSSIAEIDKAGTAKLLFGSKIEAITTDYYTNGSLYQYRLRETGRKITTLNGKDYSFENRNKAVDFTNDDNTWNDELIFYSNIKKAGCQAHWGMEKVYDYFLSKGWKSYDGKGSQITSYLNIDYVENDPFNLGNENAYWDGQAKVFVFMDGGWLYSQVVGIDVVGHEYTHSILDTRLAIPQNPYPLRSGEGGSLGESWGDIFGTNNEWKVKAGNWTIGEDSKILRYMSDPRKLNHPATYKDNKYWKDNADIHDNAGPQNFMYYLLCNGGSGKNDLGWQYSVTKIGMDKAEKIAWQTITKHVTYEIDYPSSRSKWLNGASVVFGSNSTEYKAVEAAWFAVGVAGVQPPAFVNATDGTYSDKVRISWPTKTGEFYRVFRSNSSDNATASAISGWLPAGYNFDDTSAQPGTVYYYWVKASDNNLGSNPSIFSPSDKGNKLSVASCSPAFNISASKVTQNSARINFVLPGSLSSAILEYRKSTTSTWSSKSLATNYSYNDLTGLSSSTKYYYRIKTVCLNGTSNYTPEYSFSTSATVASCSAASNLSVSNVTQNSARINFTLPGSLSSATLEYRKSTTSTWSSKSLATNYSYNDMTGLSPSTKYYYRIKTVCLNGTSNYTPEYSFSTSATVVSCAAASNLSASNVTQNSTRINFVLPGSLSSAILEYRKSTTSTWSSKSLATGYSYNDLTGLGSSTKYYYRIKTVCLNGTSNYTAEYPFSTSATVASCSAASNLSASNVTQNSARINFTLPGSLSSAMLEYRKSTSSTWSSKSLATNYSYNDLTSLSSSTKYYYRIKTVCQNGASNYSSEYSFSTSGIVANCVSASNLSNSNITSSTATVKFTLPGNISAAAIEYKTANSASWNSYSMPVNYSYINFSNLVKLTTYNVRIKVTCASGQSTYSNTLSFTTIGTKSATIDTVDPIVKIDLLATNEYSVKCFPNPAQDKLSVNILDLQHQIFDCKMLNMYGQQVFNEKFMGDQTLEIDVSKFARGVYIVVVSNTDSSKQVKVVLQ